MEKARNHGVLRVMCGHNIRNIRRSHGLSQEALAERAELHRTYISEVERGLRNIAIDNIERIANALDVAPKSLLDPDWRP